MPARWSGHCPTSGRYQETPEQCGASCFAHVTGKPYSQLILWPYRPLPHADLSGLPAFPQPWSANPYWISVHMHLKSTPLDSYLTLRGKDCKVEIGAFLAVDERKALIGDIGAHIGQIVEISYDANIHFLYEDIPCAFFYRHSPSPPQLPYPRQPLRRSRSGLTGKG
ncbi:DUF2244 domain-containing protein [Profundibacter sp.]